MTNSSTTWDSIIKPQTGLLELHLKEIWKYRDLWRMYVHRDVVTVYKQTILGPLWYFIQPLFTTITFFFIFGKMAGISTDGLPPMLFYMAGVTCWNYFAECLNRTSTTFKDNQQIFGKVYFPRLIVPLSVVTTNLVKFGIQMVMFMGFYTYFLVTGAAVQPSWYILLVPVLIVMMAGLGLGFGVVISSMTTKYKDLVFLITFGVQLWMYGTPVIYPLSEMPEQYQWIISLNPMAPIIEAFRFAFLGQGAFSWMTLGYSAVFMFVIMTIGIVVFNRTEKTFMDTI